MESKQKPNAPNFGAAAVIGLTMAVSSVYFLSQCPSSEPRRGYSRQTQSQRYEAGIRQETAVLETPYGARHNVGGVEFEYIRRDYGAEGRVRYDLGSVRIDTGMRLRSGQEATLPINETDLQVRVRVNSMDEQKLNVNVTIEPRRRD